MHAEQQLQAALRPSVSGNNEKPIQRAMLPGEKENKKKKTKKQTNKRNLTGNKNKNKHKNKLDIKLHK